MNAAVVHAFDAPPRYTTFDEPVAKGDELIVTVTAAGLHPLVKAMASGMHYGSTGALPLIPGVDGVGKLEDGSRVYFTASRVPFGSMAERSLTVRSRCLPVPESLDDVGVAAMMNPALSSWVALTGRAKFAAGESLLILGATGVAGQLAIQVAKRLGATRVVAAGRNPTVGDLKKLGADAVIALNADRDALVSSFRNEWAENKVDVVLDYLWGSPAEIVLESFTQRGLQHVAPRIRFVQVGASAGTAISLPAAILRSSGLELIGSGFGSLSMEKIHESLGDFLKEAAREPFQMKTVTAPLKDVEARWNAPQKARLVFQP
jgi:NADPH:quinone reductase-like Zn-dependent oxidoreductase